MSVVWEVEALLRVPRTYPAPGFEAEGVEALFYDALPWRGQPTRVFAWVGIPDAPSGEKCPGIVLVHGGGGTAFHDWLRFWTSRGYAAIAMDLCGCVPESAPIPPGGQRPRHEHGGPPGWDASFKQIDEPIEDQWPYHAVADIALAQSLLAAYPQVDASRIGLTGISWGGYLTCIAAGVDSRFRFAIPVYGCGFLGDNSIFKPPLEALLGPERMRRWLDLWDPSVYLPNAKMPMLWVNGTNDFAYPLDSFQKSYRLPPGERTLSVQVEMPHGHPPGQTPHEIRVFADSYLLASPPLPRITGQGVEGRRIWANFSSEVPVTKAELAYTRALGYWEDRKWHINEARLDRQSRRVEADIPPETTVCYLNLVDDRGCVVSTEHVGLEG